MNIRSQSHINSSSTAGTAELAAIIAMRSRAASGEGLRVAAPLRSAVHLLSEALVSDTKEDARKYVARAAALIQAESDLREHNTREAPSEFRGKLAPWQINRVMSFIHDNLSEKIGPQDFAALTRLCTNHFSRAFRATVGETPHAYLIHRRVERAKELMLETDLPLAQIALDCGLADQPHLTRLFKRFAGMSPAAWRRAHVAAAAA